MQGIVISSCAAISKGCASSISSKSMLYLSMSLPGLLDAPADSTFRGRSSSSSSSSKGRQHQSSCVFVKRYLDTCRTGSVAPEGSTHAQLLSKLEFAIGNVYPQQHLEHDLWHCRTRSRKQHMHVGKQNFEMLLSA